MKNSDEVFLYELYHENSKLTPTSGFEVGMRIAAFYADRTRQHKIDSSYKKYADKDPVPLVPNKLPDASFADLIRRRKSVTPLSASQYFTGRPVPFVALSGILAAGYTEIRRRMVTVGDLEFERGARTIPSGGGLYPLEVYVWNAVVASDSVLEHHQIYHLHPAMKVLEQIGVKKDTLKDCIPIIGFENNPPSTVVIVCGLHRRISVKYGERSYRFMLLEAGHLMQNMILASTALDVPAVPIGGYDDDALANVLRVDPHQEYPLYCLYLGK